MAYPMIDSVTGLYILAGDQLTHVDDPAAASYFQPTDARMFYEVVRVDRGIPVFWEDHLTRLVASVNGQIPIPQSLYTDSRRLIAANGIDEANLRIVLSPSAYVVHLAPSYYPSEQMRSTGVPTGILAWERENPNTKIIRSDYKAAVAARFAQPGPFGPYFELLLADRGGRLTEGSRSNLFFICGGQVVSAPDSVILRGITRKHVQDAIAAASLPYREDLLTLDDVRQGACSAAFLSGSPIDLLPINAIEDISLPSATDPGLRRIMTAYREIVEHYVTDRIERGLGRETMPAGGD